MPVPPLKRSAARIVAALSLASLGGAAQAQTPPEVVAAHLGEWLAVTDDGKPGCRITLASERTIGGYAATPAPNCEARGLRIGDVSAWNYDGGIRLYDPTRKLVLTLEEDETTLLKTRVAAGPATMLVRAKPGVEKAPFAPDLYGPWAMRRPDGQILCEVTLRKTPPEGGSESFGLTVGGTCDPAVRRLKLASWRIEDFTLMLYGTDGASLRFEPSAQGFEKAETGKPLSLVRLR